MPKKNGIICSCGDYSVTIDQALEIDQYLLPKPDDLFVTLARGKKYYSRPLIGIPPTSFGWRVIETLSTRITDFTNIPGCCSGLCQHQLFSRKPWTPFCPAYPVSYAMYMTWIRWWHTLKEFGRSAWMIGSEWRKLNAVSCRDWLNISLTG